MEKDKEIKVKPANSNPNPEIASLQDQVKQLQKEKANILEAHDTNLVTMYLLHVQFNAIASQLLNITGQVQNMASQTNIVLSDAQQKKMRERLEASNKAMNQQLTMNQAVN